MLRLAALRVATAVCVSAFPIAATAAAYGDTAFAPSYVAHCTATTALTLPLSISTASRIYVSARAAYTPLGNTNTEAYVHVELRDGADTTTLAVSQQAITSGSDFNSNGAGGSSGSDKGFLDSNGLLHGGTNVADPAAAIFTAAPGSYLLQMKVSSGPFAPIVCGEVGGGSGGFFNLTMTYLLLSSTFDSIFADGFQAMLNDGRRYSVVA